MTDATYQDRIPAHSTSERAAGPTTMPGSMIMPNAGSATPRGDDTDTLAAVHSPSDIPCVESDSFDKLVVSRPISTVTTRLAEDPKTSLGASTPLQLTDQTNLLPFRKILPVFAGLALCASVSALDSVIIATAMPTISDSFNAGSIASWVPSAYMLTSTSFQPLYGRSSDIFGRKLALCVAMAVYMLGSLAAGFSTSIIQLIIFRACAGAGGGGIQSMAQIIVSDIVNLRDRHVLCIFASYYKLNNRFQRQISRNYIRSYRAWLCYRTSYRWRSGPEGVLESMLFIIFHSLHMVINRGIVVFLAQSSHLVVRYLCRYFRASTEAGGRQYQGVSL